jgi:pyruvate,water dikinase
MVEHTSGSVLANEQFLLLRHLATAAGDPGLVATIATGFGGMEESAIVADLWAMSRERIDLDEFVRRHGFHGPEEGQLQSRSWREDPSTVILLCEQYRCRPATDAPDLTTASRSAVRALAQAELLRLLPPRERALARAALPIARAMIPLREVGKAAFLMAIDAGRSAARARGAELAASGALDDPDDVCFLTVDELVDDGIATVARDLARRRRARYEIHHELALPQAWFGVPVARTGGDVLPTVGPIRGFPVVPGLIEATACVAADAVDALRLVPGQVLVCRTTDPSWAPVFPLAAALVIDIGGPMSHGAIIAREMGIPCVIATGSGTAVIPDGARLRVDAGAGTVEVL